MTKQLKLSRADDAAIKVEVIENGKLLWQFVPDSKGEHISFCQFFTPSRFAVLDWGARLWLCDADKKEIYYEHDFMSDIAGAGAALSKDKNMLYVTSFRMGARLHVFNVNDLELEKTLKIPYGAESERFWVDPQGRLLFYTCKGEYDDDDWKHGMTRLDVDTEECAQFPMTAPPPSSFDQKLPTLDFDKNLGIRRYYDIDIQQGDNGPLFVHKVAVFELDKFEDQAIIATREFETCHLGYQFAGERDNEVAEALQKKDEDEDEYYRKLENFVNDLNSIYICRNEDAFWVCFRGGVLRKIALDGSSRSALVALETVPNNTVEDPLMRKYFHTHLVKSACTDDRIVFRGHDEAFVFEPAEYDISDEHALVTVPPVEFEFDKVEMTEEQKQEAADIGVNIVQMEDLESEESISAALDDLILMFDDVGTLRNDWKLVLKFRDPARNELDEEEFFKRAVQVADGPRRIEKILRKFMAYDGYEDLYYHEEMIAMAHALTALVLHDPQFVDLYVDYWRKLDTEHDVYNQEFLLYEVFATHDWSPSMLRLLAVAEIWGQDVFLSMADDQKLLEYLEDEEHMKMLQHAIRQESEDLDYRLESWSHGDGALYEKICASFEKAAAADSEGRSEAEALLERGRQIGLQGNWQDAADILAKAARLDPFNTTLLNLYAYALLATDNAKAPVVLNKILELDPRNVDALANLAAWHYRHDEIEKGGAAYSRFFDCSPSTETMYHCYLSDIHGADFPAQDKAAEFFLDKAKHSDAAFEEKVIAFGQIANTRVQIANAINTGQHAQVVELAEQFAELVREFYGDSSSELSDVLFTLFSRRAG